MFRAIGIALSALLATIVIAAALTGAGLAVRYLLAEVRGVVTAEEQIQSAGSRITRYEHFFDLCAAVQGNEAAIDTLEISLEAASSDRERERLTAAVNGVRAQRVRNIQQYNADARKDYTSGQFRASSLPYQLDPAQEVTSCVAY